MSICQTFLTHATPRWSNDLVFLSLSLFLIVSLSLLESICFMSPKISFILSIFRLSPKKSLYAKMKPTNKQRKKVYFFFFFFLLIFMMIDFCQSDNVINNIYSPHKFSKEDAPVHRLIKLCN